MERQNHDLMLGELIEENGSIEHHVRMHSSSDVQQKSRVEIHGNKWPSQYGWASASIGCRECHSRSGCRLAGTRAFVPNATAGKFLELRVWKQEGLEAFIKNFKSFWHRNSDWCGLGLTDMASDWDETREVERNYSSLLGQLTGDFCRSRRKLRPHFSQPRR
jgi:hypothetical protein